MGIVHDYNGDVIKFAGDAITVIWAINVSSGEYPTTLAEAAFCASQCAQAIHKKLHKYVAVDGPDPVHLSLHIGIGCGQMTNLHVGGVFNRWEFVVGGPPMSEMGNAEPAAEPGETVVAPSVWEHIKDHAKGTALRELASEHRKIDDEVEGCVRLAALALSHLPPPPPRARQPTNQPGEGKGGAHHDDRRQSSTSTISVAAAACFSLTIPASVVSSTVCRHRYMRLDAILDVGPRLTKPYQAPAIQITDLEYLRRYIPFAVHKRLEAGHDAYIAEIRPLSILFMQINGFQLQARPHEDGTSDCSEAVKFGQELMLKVQEIIYHFEGSMNKMMIDDKGQVILCVFGLNPYFHHDDPLRAVKASVALVERFHDGRFRKGVTIRVGVASGSAFCGVVGSKDRREYTVMGNVVNMAARLMCAAKEDGALVDEATKSLSSTRSIKFSHFADLKLKGMKGLKSCFMPSRNKNAMVADAHTSANLALDFRANELLRVDSMLQPRQPVAGILLVIVGDRGSGKDAVTKDTIARGEKLGYKVFLNSKKMARQKSSIHLKSAFDVTETATNFTTPTFTTWVTIFRGLVEEAASDPEIIKGHETIESLISSVLKSHPHLALLNIVLSELKLAPPPRPTSESDTLSQISEEADTPGTPFSSCEAPEMIEYWQLDLEQRTKLLTQMLSRLLQFFADRKPNGTLVVLHLQTGTSYKLISDPESWILAKHISDKLIKNRNRVLPKLVLCVVSRPSVYYSPDEFVHMQKTAESNRTLIILGPLSKKERRQYLARYLNVDIAEIPAPLVKFVSDMGAGNPKHIEEIMASFKAEEIFTVQDQKVVLRKDLTVDGAIEGLFDKLPKKTTDAALTLLERLQPRHQLIVKIASMWDIFSEYMLRDVIPESLVEEREALLEILDNLVEGGILEVEHETADILDFHPESPNCGSYSFVSKVLQRKAAALMLEEHHQELEARKSDLERRRSIYRNHRATMAGIKIKIAHFLGMTNTRQMPSLSEDSFNQRFVDGGNGTLQRRRGFRARVATNMGKAARPPQDDRAAADVALSSLVELNKSLATTLGGGLAAQNHFDDEEDADWDAAIQPPPDWNTSTAIANRRKSAGALSVSDLPQRPTSTRRASAASNMIGSVTEEEEADEQAGVLVDAVPIPQIRISGPVDLGQPADQRKGTKPKRRPAPLDLSLVNRSMVRGAQAEPLPCPQQVGPSHPDIARVHAAPEATPPHVAKPSQPSPTPKGKTPETTARQHLFLTPQVAHLVSPAPSPCVSSELATSTPAASPGSPTGFGLATDPGPKSAAAAAAAMTPKTSARASRRNMSKTRYIVGAQALPAQTRPRGRRRSQVEGSPTIKSPMVSRMSWKAAGSPEIVRRNSPGLGKSKNQQGRKSAGKPVIALHSTGRGRKSDFIDGSLRGSPERKAPQSGPGSRRTSPLSSDGSGAALQLELDDLPKQLQLGSAIQGSPGEFAAQLQATQIRLKAALAESHELADQLASARSLHQTALSLADSENAATTERLDAANRAMNKEIEKNKILVQQLREKTQALELVRQQQEDQQELVELESRHNDHSSSDEDDGRELLEEQFKAVSDRNELLLAEVQRLSPAGKRADGLAVRLSEAEEEVAWLRKDKLRAHFKAQRSIHETRSQSVDPGILGTILPPVFPGDYDRAQQPAAHLSLSSAPLVITDPILVPPPMFPGSEETSPATRRPSLPRGGWSSAPPTIHSFGSAAIPPPQMPPPAASFATDESSDSETNVDGAQMADGPVLNLSFENFESSI